MANDKIVVLGGGGFLGRRIIEMLLERGAQDIHSFGRRPQPELVEMGVNVICGDLQNAQQVADAISGAAIVFHTAAKAGFWGTWQDYYGPNVLGTENVLAACREHQVPFLVYTSSPSVAYPPTRHIEGIDESTPYPEQYLSHYPHSKAIAEKAVLAANSKSLRTVALRPHLIWGPRDPHLIPRLVAKAKAGRLRQVGESGNKVDLTYVDNAAIAHIAAAEALKKGFNGGKAYFISDGAPVELWPWIDHLLSLCQVNPVSRRISLAAAWRIGAVCEGVFKLLPFLGEPPMTRFVAGQLAHSHYFDISAAKRDLNYSPSVTNDDGVTRTVAWLKETGIA